MFHVSDTYIVVMMGLSTMSIILAIFVQHLYFSGSHVPIPKYLRPIMFHFLYRLLFFRKYTTHGITENDTPNVSSKVLHSTDAEDDIKLLPTKLDENIGTERIKNVNVLIKLNAATDCSVLNKVTINATKVKQPVEQIPLKSINTPHENLKSTNNNSTTTVNNVVNVNDVHITNNVLNATDNANIEHDIQPVDVSVDGEEFCRQLIKRIEISQLTDVLEHLKYITKRYREKDRESGVSQEWKTIAKILDRLCFVISILFALVGSILLLLQHEYVDDHKHN